MKHAPAVVMLVACVAVGVALYSAARPFAQLAERLVESIDALGGAEFLAEPAVDQLVDRINESGAPQPLDRDDPLLAQRVILITEGMNERVARHVIERLIFLDGEDGSAPIALRISTSGGWIDSAFAIVDTMGAISAPVNVIATGGCYSAGTVILAAATGERSATPNAVLSVHVNDYQPEGRYDFDTAELDRFRSVYRLNTRVPRAWFEEPGDNQYYFDAEEALRLGLIDKIAAPRSTPARRPEGEAAERRPAA